MAFIEIAGSAGVLTGAGSGIGRATAHELARRGMKVVVSDVLGERAEQTAAEITAAGGVALSLPSTSPIRPTSRVCATSACPGSVPSTW